MKNFYLPLPGWLLTLLLLTTLALPNTTQAQTIYPGDSVKLSVSNTYRGQLIWQESVNGSTWTDIPKATTNNSWVKPARATQYRAKITEDQCAPVYSNVRAIAVSTGTGLTVATTAATNVTADAATAGGTISRLGGDAKVTARGVCWNTSPSPTIAHSKTSEGTGTGAFPSALSGLKEKTLYYTRAYATLASGLTLYGDQVSFTTLQAVVVSTTGATAILPYTATAGGTVTNNTSGTITAKGVCWSTSPNPTIAHSKTNDRPGGGTFSSALTGLIPETIYYIRAYATTSAGLTVYGPQSPFQTPKSVTVTTGTVAAITPTGASAGGTVTVLGSETITARGLCWNTSPSPTIAHSKTSDGNGTGTFTSAISGLTPQTTYYVRAYATSAAGTVYGNTTSFTTQSAYLVATNNPVGVDVTSVAVSGSVAPNGTTTETIIARGVCWNTSPNPTIANNKTTNGAGTGSFTAAITGLTPITTYYVRAYARTNAGKTIYGEGKIFITASPFILATSSVGNITATTAATGGSISIASLRAGTVTARGVCWSTSQHPTIADHKTSNGAGTGAFSSVLTDLLPNTTYYVRAYGNSSLGVTVYGAERSFTTDDGLAVTTSAISAKTAFSASAGGNVTITAPESIILERGVCWSTAPNPTIADSKTEDGTTEGAFTSSLGDLRASTQYYVRAYATSGTGKTTYGNQVTFSTEQALVVTVSTATATGITASGAKSGGTVSSTGFGSITSRGVCWSLHQHPTIDDAKVISGSGAGTFISAIRVAASGKHYVRAFATTSFGTTVYGNEITFTPPSPLQVTTADVTGITAVSAMGGGNISVLLNGEGVLERGLCWSTSPNPTTDGDARAYAGGAGTFLQQMTGLSGNTTYYVRAFGYTASEVIVYGNQVSFTTNPPPAPRFTVTTSPLLGITSYGCLSGGTIAGLGNITSRGICYSTQQNPTLADAKIYGGRGLGSFASTLKYLQPNTRYYIRAFATADDGAIAYGNELILTTNPESNLTVTTSSITNILANYADGGGNVSGTGPVEGKGLCFSTSPNPVLTQSGQGAMPMGDGPGSFYERFGVLTPNTTYYVRAFALSSGKTFYGNEVSFTSGAYTVATGNATEVLGVTASVPGTVTLFGSNPIKVKGICWSTTPEPTIADSKTSNGTAGGNFTGSLTGLQVSTKYYARAYATDNANKTIYGNQITFTTQNHPSIFVEVVGADVFTTSIRFAGTIKSLGPQTVTGRGVCWSTANTNPTLQDSKLSGGSGAGYYLVTMPGLNPGTVYYCRAYAISNTGAIIYSEVLPIATKVDVPIPDPGTGGGDTGGDTGGDSGGGSTPSTGGDMLLTYVVYAPSSATACKQGGFDDSKGYFTKVIYSKDLQAEKSRATAQLKSQYGSSATLVYASTYLTNLKYAAVIRYTKKFTGWSCEVPRIMIGFGNSASDALSKAISKKNSDAGSSTPHTVLKQLHW